MRPTRPATASKRSNALKPGSPDLVLLDVMMPRMDGFEVCRHIRAKSAVPIIMLTAKAEEEDELQGFGLGVDEYISKPFSLKILAARIEAVLRRRSAPGTTASPALPSGLSVDTAGRVVRWTANRSN